MKYRDYSRVDRERQEQADIDKDFREGLRLGAVCRRLRLTREKVREALFSGRLLGIQQERGRFRSSKEGEEFKYPWKTCYRYPAWQFEEKVRRSLPTILRLIKKKIYPEDGVAQFDVFNFYKLVQDYLFNENRHLEEKKPIDLLRQNKNSAKKVIKFFRKL